MPVYKNVLAPSVNQNHPDELKETPESGTNHLVYMVDPANLYKMCETYHFYFTSTGATNYPCLLTIGALSATTSCTIGNYIIEWHLNSIEGSVVLTCGVGTDPNYPGMVQVPFTNQPVPGGVLYPVIVYIYVNGDKYTSYPDPNARYSPDLKTCISPISVFDLNCYNGGQGSTPSLSQYSHWISYNYTTSSPNQASRELSFVLNTGGTTQYFAWWFAGYYYADKVKISYIRKADMTETVLDYWNIGQTATPTDYTTTPKKWANQYFQFVTNLTGITYNNGDYLKINITPNESNPLTNWDIYFKCKGSFNCISPPVGWNYPDTGTTVVTSGSSSSSCYFTLSFNSLSGYNWTLSDFYSYYTNNSNTMYGIGTASYTPTTDTMSGTLYRYSGYTTHYNSYTSTCTVYSDIYTIQKTGSILTLTFNSSTDYNLYKSSFDYCSGLTSMSGYTSDNTDLNHYKFYLFYAARSGLTCGDGQQERNFTFHYSSPINWDSTGKTIGIQLTNTTNGIAEIQCNNIHSNIDSWISQVNSSISQSNFTWTSIKLGGLKPFGCFSSQLGPYTYVNETEKEFYYYIYANATLVNNVCSLTSWYSSGSNYYLYKCRFKVKITNTSDPLNNYELYHGLDSNGYPSTYTLIYSKP